MPSQTMNKKAKQYVYKSTLREVYGLTPAMIEELGGPDEYGVNPHYRSGPPTNLYRIERVEAWIKANEERVEQARQSRATRSAAAKQAHAQKRAEQFRQAEHWVRSVAIEVEQPLPDTLLSDVQSYYGSPRTDGPTERQFHSYVRHELTNYDLLRHELKEKGYSDELYPLLRGRVDAVVQGVLVELHNEGRTSGTQLAELFSPERVNGPDARLNAFKASYRAVADPPATWPEYLQRYGFAGQEVAEALAKALESPGKAHPVWFCEAMLAIERSRKQINLDTLTYEQVAQLMKEWRKERLR